MGSPIVVIINYIDPSWRSTEALFDNLKSAENWIKLFKSNFFQRYSIIEDNIVIKSYKRKVSND
jgi:hypothetical protein